MIFNRKITLYLADNGDDTDVSFTEVADLAASAGDDWLVAQEYGQYEHTCECGDPECDNAEVREVPQ